uniref:Uncharacterized protein n=1 Tax=Arundo donax TaxID=35708 RepID=A0A0A9B7N9_ARUDO
MIMLLERMSWLDDGSQKVLLVTLLDKMNGMFLRAISMSLSIET